MTSEPDEGRVPRAEPGSRLNPTVRSRAGAESGSRLNPVVRERIGAEPGSRANPLRLGREDAQPGSLANPRVPERLAAVAARHLPIPGLIGSRDAPRESPNAATPVPPASGDQAARGKSKSHLSGAVADAIDATTTGGHGDARESESVAQAAGQGFVSGFAGVVAAPRGHAVPAAELQARMERFPELRGVQVPDGRAARFPELGERGTEEGVRQSTDGDLER